MKARAEDRQRHVRSCQVIVGFLVVHFFAQPSFGSHVLVQVEVKVRQAAQKCTAAVWCNGLRPWCVSDCECDRPFECLRYAIPTL